MTRPPKRSVSAPTGIRPSEPTTTGTATTSACWNDVRSSDSFSVGTERAEQRPGPEVHGEADRGDRQDDTGAARRRRTGTRRRDRRRFDRRCPCARPPSPVGDGVIERYRGPAPSTSPEGRRDRRLSRRWAAVTAGCPGWPPGPPVLRVGPALPPAAGTGAPSRRRWSPPGHAGARIPSAGSTAGHAGSAGRPRLPCRMCGGGTTGPRCRASGSSPAHDLLRRSFVDSSG